MGYNFSDANVQCPYYKETDGKRLIKCAGLAGSGSSIVLTYLRKQDFRIQYDAFCCCKFRNCEIYRALESIYDD